VSTAHSQTLINGFAVHTLKNHRGSISLAPELGGKIVSLHDLTHDREWLDGWSPTSERRLWKPDNPSDFETSSGSGIDECLPTVLPCNHQETSIPDHGEIWSKPAHLEITGCPTPALTCSWELLSLPLQFRRTLSLDDNEVVLDYQLRNTSDSAAPFLWAWHPLFTLQEGDQIHLSSENPDSIWPSMPPGQDLARAQLDSHEPSCAKAFLGPISTGQAEIRGKKSTLTLRWPEKQFPWLGIWITRGAWKELHHWALEPTNHPVDRLSETPPGDPLTTLSPREERSWKIHISF